MKNQSTRIIYKDVLDQLRVGQDAYLYNEGPAAVQLTTPSGEIVYVNYMNLKHNVPQLDNQLNRLPADCYGATLTFEQAMSAVAVERDYQQRKYGDKAQSLPGFLLIMQREVQEAIDGWMASIEDGRDSPLHEVVQVAATAVACIERYGATGITNNSNDTPIPY